MILVIKRIKTRCDFRKIHKPRQSVIVQDGEAHLFFNRAQTMARLISSDQDVFTFYAPKGEIFDLQEIQDRLMRVGKIALKLAPKASTKQRLMKVA